MPSPKISITIQEEILKELDARGARSSIINRDLDRLYGLYRRALAKITFTKKEAMLILDALNASLYDENTASLLWAGIDDAISLDRLDDKWGVDGKRLVAKLRQLNEIEALAIIDASERFWYGEKYRDIPIEDAVFQLFSIREEE